MAAAAAAATIQTNEETQVRQSNMDEKTVSDAIVRFIIMDLHLPGVVEGRGFQKLMATLRSPGKIPSKEKLEDEIIPELYDDIKDFDAAGLASMVDEFGLAIEEWRSNSGESFATVSMYYHHLDEFSLVCKVLKTLHVPIDWDESQWGTAIDTLLRDWNFKIDRITAVVVGSSKPELLAALAGRNLTIVPCLLHTLQIWAQTCFENPEVAAILAKCRSLIGEIVRHPAASAALRMKEQILELNGNAMIMDYPPVWTSTYRMLEQLSLRRDIIASLLDEIKGIDPDVFNLTNEQWKFIKDIVEGLKPFEQAIMPLSNEKMPLLSLLTPLLWQLLSTHSKVKDSDSKTTRSFKELLDNMLCKRYADPSVKLTLQIATVLDPRFKQLPNATDGDQNLVTGRIEEMLTKVVKEVEGIESRFRGLTVTESDTSAEEKASLELKQYQSKAPAPFNYCPLTWWAEMAAIYPNLAILARRYNCVPACCAPPLRIPAEARVLYNKKRANLSSHLADQMLFLHGNYNMYCKESPFP